MSRTYRSKEQARVYWQDVLKRWQQSGLSIHRFCHDHRICESGFYTWRKKLSITPSPAEPSSSKLAESPFIQVDVPATPQSPLTLQLATGHRLHMAYPVDTEALVKVIGALQEAKLC